MRRFFINCKELAKLRLKDADPEAYDNFNDECAINNRTTAVIILWTLLVLEGIMTALYFLQPVLAPGQAFYPNYLFLYCFMVAFCTLMLVALKLNSGSPKVLMIFELLILVTIGIWSALFSANDIRNGLSSYLFVQFIIINSVVFRIKPLKHCLINTFSFVVYSLLILNGGLAFKTAFAEFVNPLFMLLVSFIMTTYLYKSRYMSFINEKLIREQNIKLEYYANYDFLTRIPNRKSIMEYLDDRLESNIKNISCIMIDVDDFKLYNDTYGHIAGDDCLIRLAAAINRFAIKHGGRAGRLGGEEFIVLFADKERGYISRIANAIVKLVRDESIIFESDSKAPNQNENVVTISAGVAFQEQKFNRNKLLRDSDEALYRAKQEGKNRAIFHVA